MDGVIYDGSGLICVCLTISVCRQPGNKNAYVRVSFKFTHLMFVHWFIFFCFCFVLFCILTIGVYTFWPVWFGVKKSGLSLVVASVCCFKTNKNKKFLKIDDICVWNFLDRYLCSCVTFQQCHPWFQPINQFFPYKKKK